MLFIFIQTGCEEDRHSCKTSVKTCLLIRQNFIGTLSKGVEDVGKHMTELREKPRQVYKGKTRIPYINCRVCRTQHNIKTLIRREILCGSTLFYRGGSNRRPYRPDLFVHRGKVTSTV